ncbi:MAG: hypothetical protein Fur0044_53010 [Anaerolineae bacterium]|nr:hypothetical protein [Anaerolineales bacterium]MCQ3974972.1 hypothetical protein [Anaerolineae bacterium]
MIAPTILSQMWSTLTGRSRPLLTLAEIEAACTVLGYTYVGRQMVQLNQIRGSASPARCYDFDADFRLLKVHNESRWARISAARQRGAKLPPVALIRVGDIYFVEDGHHRISVAKTQREQEIEAEVTVLQISGPLPWEDHAPVLA